MTFLPLPSWKIAIIFCKEFEQKIDGWKITLWIYHNLLNIFPQLGTHFASSSWPLQTPLYMCRDVSVSSFYAIGPRSRSEVQ